MITPTHNTDAAPPEYKSKGLIFLAGAIKYWWLHVCETCESQYWESPEDNRCTLCEGRTHNLWGGPEHTAYVQWRNDVQQLFIAEKYLVYAPHMAFKGTWTDDAQIINDMAIQKSKAMLVLSPPNIPTPGTDEEVVIAHSWGVPVIYAPPGTDLGNMLKAVELELYWSK